MNEEEKLNQMGFREWTSHYEKEQEADREKINEIANIVGSLGGQVSKLSANIETLMENQKGLYDRMNRPWQWGVIVAAFALMLSMAGLFATVLTLTVNPVREALHELAETSTRINQRNYEYHINQNSEHKADLKEMVLYREQQAAANARQAANIEWLRRLEERGNRRIHGESK